MPLAFCSWGEAAVLGCWAPICAVGCYSGQLDQDLGHLWGLMTCQKWCLVLTLGQLLSAAMGHRGSAALHCLWWSILEEASSPFCIRRTSKAFAELQRMPFEVAKSAHQLKKASLSLCQGVQGDVPGGAALCVPLMGTEMASLL